MKNCYLLAIIFTMIACHTTKPTPENSQAPSNEENQENVELQFGCYNAADTLIKLILYFPEEKAFFVNNKPCKKENLCETMQYDIQTNKGVLYYLSDNSNFLYAMSIIKEVEKCYQASIEELCIKEYGVNYSMLNLDQKTKVDSTIFYRMLSE